MIAYVLDQLGLGMDSELPENALKMVSHRGPTDGEPVGDAGHAASGAEFREDFLLAWTEGILGGQSIFLYFSRSGLSVRFDSTRRLVQSASVGECLRRCIIGRGIALWRGGGSVSE